MKNLSEISNFKDKKNTQKAAKANSISFQSRAMSPGAGFTQKLHLIYLINDLLNYWLVSETKVAAKSFRFLVALSFSYIKPT
jgi:hypothetical protein